MNHNSSSKESQTLSKQHELQLNEHFLLMLGSKIRAKAKIHAERQQRKTIQEDGESVRHASYWL